MAENLLVGNLTQNWNATVATILLIVWMTTQQGSHLKQLLLMLVYHHFCRSNRKHQTRKKKTPESNLIKAACLNLQCCQERVQWFILRSNAWLKEIAEISSNVTYLYETEKTDLGAKKCFICVKSALMWSACLQEQSLARFLVLLRTFTWMNAQPQS